MGDTMDALDRTVRYEHPDFGGIALHVRTHPVIQYDLAWDDYIEEYVEAEYADYGFAEVIMVGDDRVHIVDAEDLIPLDDDAYCSECGQIGCTHG